MKTRQEQVDELQEKINALKLEETTENQKLILPLLQKYAICHFRESGRINVEFTDDEKGKEIMRLTEGRQGGFYHFGCLIAEGVSLRFDDDEVTLRFEYSGRVSESVRKIIFKCKELGLKLSFDEVISEFNGQILNAQKRINGILDLKKLYEQES